MEDANIKTFLQIYFQNDHIQKEDIFWKMEDMDDYLEYSLKDSFF
jgi:hypothetical protein